MNKLKIIKLIYYQKMMNLNQNLKNQQIKKKEQ
jgi:hypothetical protein